MVTITATAPTVYQLRSLSAFGFGYQNNPDGSFYFCEEFDTKEEAIEALIIRANMLHNDGQHFEILEELSEAIADIKKYGTLTIGAVTARIN